MFNQPPFFMAEAGSNPTDEIDRWKTQRSRTWVIVIVVVALIGISICGATVVAPQILATPTALPTATMEDTAIPTATLIPQNTPTPTITRTPTKTQTQPARYITIPVQITRERTVQSTVMVTRVVSIPVEKKVTVIVVHTVIVQVTAEPQQPTATPTPTATATRTPQPLNFTPSVWVYLPIICFNLEISSVGQPPQPVMTATLNPYP